MEGEKITILEPTIEVLEKAEFYLNFIRKALPEAKVTLIGSLAIPVCIKNEIDILVEVEEGEDIQKVQEKIKDENQDLFRVGPIVDNEGYSRTKKKHGLICELHILHRGDKRIEKYLKLIERFKSNPELAKTYSDLKKSLNGVSNDEYKKVKIEFLKKNGFLE
jgi:GrpB-like predicted nucleotidyltransferase (UPF0157 family)